jgi:hypothetical protein
MTYLNTDDDFLQLGSCFVGGKRPPKSHQKGTTVCYQLKPTENVLRSEVQIVGSNLHLWCRIELGKGKMLV